MVATGRQRLVAARERAFRFLRDRPYRFFREPLGKLLFRVAGIGLRAKVRPAPPAIERTEVLLAAAAHSIYEALAMEYRSRLAEVPGVIRHLEAHAETLRKRRHELDRALPPARNENAQGHSELEAARAVDGRLATVVAALENLRLALLRLSTGQRSIDDLTADLEKAREIGAEIDRLLEGQQEVADILESEETIPR